MVLDGEREDSSSWTKPSSAVLQHYSNTGTMVDPGMTRSRIELSLKAPPNRIKQKRPFLIAISHWIVENIKHKTRVLHISLLHEILNKQIIECF